MVVPAARDHSGRSQTRRVAGFVAAEQGDQRIGIEAPINATNTRFATPDQTLLKTVNLYGPPAYTASGENYYHHNV